MKNLLKKIPTRLKGKNVDRHEACNLCGAKKGLQIGEVDFWDIRNSRIVKCETCGHAQLDPMLTADETAKGCLAFYIERSHIASEKSQSRNMLRNFRRGILFAYSLKKQGFYPENVLELGPGSGYFVEGLKFVFPRATVTVMDVNREVLRFIKDQHENNTIQNDLENYIPDLDNKFDLIIARDVIEHVIDFAKVIDNVKRYLKDNGLFHFITPNGHEDVWKHYLTFNHLQSKSELLINHVNYFDGQGLLNFLIQNDFSPIQYYTYKLKTTRKGRGWKVSKNLMAPISDEKSSDLSIKKGVSTLDKTLYTKEKILNRWYIKQNRKFFTYFVSWYHHAKLIRLSPDTNVGHEIFGLFKIRKQTKDS